MFHATDTFHQRPPSQSDYADGTIFVPLKTLQKKGADETGQEDRLFQLPDMQVGSFNRVKLSGTD